MLSKAKNLLFAASYGLRASSNPPDPGLSIARSSQLEARSGYDTPAFDS